jgi:hypothetical protein
MSVACRWAPAQGTQVEVLLDHPVVTGAVKHKCWKGGTVTATTEVRGKQCAEVELPVVGVSKAHLHAALRESNTCIPLQLHGMHGAVLPAEASTAVWSLLSLGSLRRTKVAGCATGTDTAVFTIARHSQHHSYVQLRGPEATCASVQLHVLVSCCDFLRYSWRPYSSDHAC